MLPKNRRLTALQVKDTIAHGRSVRASLLSAKCAAHTSELRASVVVSKKVAKKAVERNRVRRAVYRALDSVQGRGTFVIFVHKIPEGPLTPRFVQDLLLLIPSAH